MNPAASVRVNLHVGAHKTATSYIQSVLEQNAGLLKQRGIRCPGLKETRSAITRRVQKALHRGLPVLGHWSSVSAIRRYVSDIAAEGCSTLVISDENLVGTSREIRRRSDLYPRARQRLGVMKKALRRFEVDAFICVRDYAEYFPAAYCEYLRHNDFIGFEEYFGDLRDRDSLWPRVIADMISVFGEDRVHVWKYEDFAGHQASIIGRLVSDEGLPLVCSRRKVRPSMSMRAVQELGRLPPHGGASGRRERVKELVARFPRSGESPAYSPWDETERKYWQERYRQDIEKIAEHGQVFLEYA